MIFQSMEMGNQNKSLSILSPIATIFLIIMIASVSVTVLFQQQQQILAQQEPGTLLKLSRASIPIDIPLRKGYVNGNEVFYITTDTSDKKIADQITNLT